MPRCRRQPASRRIWSLTTREPRCTVTDRMVTASGVVCQSLTIPTPLPCSERTSPTPIFIDQRLPRRCACKHRNIRREISCGCDPAKAGWQRCSFFSVVSGAEFSTKALLHFIRLARPPTSTIPFLRLGGHRSRAGCLSANQGMPVQIRLTAPFSNKHNMRTAGASLRRGVPKTPRARGSTETPCHFQWAARLVSKSAGLHPAVRGA